MQTYKWNQIVRHETYTSKMANTFGEYPTFHRVTIAAGTTGEGLTTDEARLYAEQQFEAEQPNQFVVRHGSPTHVQLTELTADEVRERIPGIVL